MKKEILVLVFMLCYLSITSQEFYKFSDKSEILTKIQLENKISELNIKAKKNGNKNATHRFKASYKILKTLKKSDSIINIVRYDIKYESTRNEKIFILENKKIPEFKLRNIESKRRTLEHYKGKVTLINLWFTNCFPCVKEIPLLNTLKEKYKNEVNFVAITFDSKEKVKHFLKKKKFNFEQIVNAKNYLKKELGNRSYPKIILLNKQGVIKYVGGGIPTVYDYEKKKMKERTEKDLVYLENIIEELNK
ncbi:TlpA disulfide reductase family protein [uncultured Polaribacter sp.]|uniref:TlpA family protein disulfide reductase n=1 Tax=uncultured Polaribacter sp. TaxID=174711 RepID=UPI002620801D|nr:TlpA disulfide reductase family protein [uncultured Polaribacter sp.]